MGGREPAAFSRLESLFRWTPSQTANPTAQIKASKSSKRPHPIFAPGVGCSASTACRSARLAIRTTPYRATVIFNQAGKSAPLQILRSSFLTSAIIVRAWPERQIQRFGRPPNTREIDRAS